MARINKTKTERSGCELIKSKRKRIAADKLAASVKDDLPAGLAKPALRALAAGGFTSLERFTRINEGELLKLHGMGPKAVATIRSSLRARGLSFRS
ncbi:MAG: hypothetical protein QOJ64_4265 [Acidobacteriota bacterium]|jgi:hypothetical protein|nr:hypothetical protein [Acidobacteriota bacterium]